MRKLILHGCGGHARSVAAAVGGQYEIRFLDAGGRPGETMLGFRVFRTESEIPDFAECLHHVASGDLEFKKQCFTALLIRHLALPALSAADARIMPEAVLEDGVFIGAGAYVGPRARIGANSIVNTHAVVEHDAQIGAHSHISIHATVAGYTRIGALTMLGAGATVIDKLELGDALTIGAGAVVCESLAGPGVYAGVPARRLRS